MSGNQFVGIQKGKKEHSALYGHSKDMHQQNLIRRCSCLEKESTDLLMNRKSLMTWQNREFREYSNLLRDQRNSNTVRNEH